MDRVELVASQAGDLPALPQVAGKVLELVRDPNVKIQDLAAVISRDQGLTAQVLRVANSAYYGVRGTVSTLNRAIVVLGFNTLRSVVVANVTKGLYRTPNSSFKDRMVWEHSLATALGARILANRCSYAAADEAFIAGLLHDIGKVVMDRNHGEEYQRVIELVYNEGHTFVDAETEVFGFDHTEVGSLVVKRWSLTPDIVEAVRLHHQPMSADTDPTLCAVVSLANSLCVKLEIGPERRPDLVLIELDSALMLPVDEAMIEEICVQVREELENEKQLLSVA